MLPPEKFGWAKSEEQKPSDYDYEDRMKAIFGHAETGEEGKRWSECLERGMRLAGTGFLVGSTLSLLMFKSWPCVFGSGMGFAMAVDQCFEQYSNPAKPPRYK